MGNNRSGGPASRVLAIGVVACLISAACGSVAVTQSPSATTPAASGCLIGAAWDTAAIERYSRWDEPMIKWALAESNARFESLDGRASAELQASQIDRLVAEGAKVILLRVQRTDTGEVPPATQSAIHKAVDAGVAVVGYDDFIDSPGVLWATFDQAEIGRMEARAVLAAKPKGNYVIIRGEQGQVMDDQLAAGIHEVLQPAIDRGDIKIVSETYTHWWDPSQAQIDMKTALAWNDNKIDAVIAETDGLADGAISALEEVGLEGKVAVAGQGLDSLGLANIVQGVQLVDVWSDLRLMGLAMGKAAITLCHNPDVGKLDGITLFSSPGHNQIPTLALKPQTITKDNLRSLFDSGWFTPQEFCAIDPSACQ